MRRFKKYKPLALLLKLDGIPTTDAELFAKGLSRSLHLSVCRNLQCNSSGLSFTSLWHCSMPGHIWYRWRRETTKADQSKQCNGTGRHHPRILEEAADVLALSLFSLFTDSVLTGTYKQYGNRLTWHLFINLVTAIRAPAITPSVSKAYRARCWKVWSKRAILDHLQRYNLISDMQHGFLPGRSCYTNLLLFMDSLTRTQDDGLISDAIFDFAKAFDKVPHKPLLHKLQAYGVCGELLQWITSFPTDRSFRMKVDQTLSSPASVYSGVPQGSVPGSLLLLI